MSIMTNFSPERWEKCKADWSAFWAGDIGRPMLWIERYEQPAEAKLPEAPHFIPHLPMEMSPDEIVDRYEATFSYRYYHGDAVPKWFVNYGAGVAAAFLGAHVGVNPETIWFSPADEKPLDQIKIQRDDENVWWQRVLRVSQAAARRWQNNITVSHADIGGNLDILASLRGTENLLMDMLDCPEEVERAIREITQEWMWYFDRLHEAAEAGAGHGSWGPLWSPGRTYMLQSDFSYMIAPDMFERFVLPDLEACCSHLDNSYYHLDGKGELPHLDMILSIEKLHGVQWVPGAGQPPAAKWPEVLRKIRRAGKSCQVYCTTKEALQIAAEHGGNGFVFFISDPNLKTEDIPDFIKALNAQKY